MRTVALAPPEVSGPLLITKWAGDTPIPIRAAQDGSAPSLTVNVPCTLTPDAQVSDPHTFTRSSVALGNRTLLLEPTVMVPLARNVVPEKMTLRGLRSLQLMNTLAWGTTRGVFVVHDEP